MRIFLDLDGVLADFVGGACQWHNKPNPYEDETCAGRWGIHELLKLTPEEFWKPLQYDFWRGLKKTSEADDIMALALHHVGRRNVCILTSPSKDPTCITAKREWVKEHYPELADKLIFTSAKPFCAAPQHLLIDDYDDNVDKFRAAGGKAILVPRDWNSAYRLADHTLDHLRFLLEAK